MLDGPLLDAAAVYFDGTPASFSNGAPVYFSTGLPFSVHAAMSPSRCDRCV